MVVVLPQEEEVLRLQEQWHHLCSRCQQSRHTFPWRHHLQEQLAMGEAQQHEEEEEEVVGVLLVEAGVAKLHWHQSIRQW